ncbi:type II toxin-antitoxin system RelE/ParE family toxin [Roseobacter sp. HKCCD9010]|uniref:type II toxin-antitoxin system RelE/ParE family toxin n=1 Tax=unclassified Roseobacter TaxID=196798 RepID=UPI0014929937|nr:MULTISPECIES: type II toxin-antitoxin system RelE/ParE family toxin [unclassified Roseobacter]MBF9052170.1 type II toxin-antitoxin system RelE/ParE family toxin [Rhodobacterales bacterium HKCCD4356]NNV14125.1 type II toxin-antitoxin system RelE/ParE family toxin [Roseobacter sp. HKCCD7357]NNV18330.1 type II toxin-antitoxin system RelE/ParE family toxin [Roseobacter sp. HKCCD8768]NNV27789.1 type II toxin-antitoxin system RelE/ParE family toxin [Roseobacter sp. HKCCD8192]NNV32064.1 type II to
MGAYRLTAKADEDLTNLYRYGIETFELARADNYFDSLIVHLTEISDAPMQFQKSDYREGYRRSVHHPHTIYYRIINSDLVEVVRILRGQDPREL